RSLDPASIVTLLAEEEVTVTAGVPTIWLGVADELGNRGVRLPSLRYMVCGGSQPPRPMIERYLKDFGLQIVQAWGMTETSPLASIAWPQQRMHSWTEERVTDEVRTKAGLPLMGVDVTLRDAGGHTCPW